MKNDCSRKMSAFYEPVPLLQDECLTNVPILLVTLCNLRHIAEQKKHIIYFKSIFILPFTVSSSKHFHLEETYVSVRTHLAESRMSHTLM